MSLVRAVDVRNVLFFCDLCYILSDTKDDIIYNTEKEHDIGVIFEQDIYATNQQRNYIIIYLFFFFFWHWNKIVADDILFFSTWYFMT